MPTGEATISSPPSVVVHILPLQRIYTVGGEDHFLEMFFISDHIVIVYLYENRCFFLVDGWGGLLYEYRCVAVYLYLYLRH